MQTLDVGFLVGALDVGFGVEVLFVLSGVRLSFEVQRTLWCAVGGGSLRRPFALLEVLQQVAV